MQLKFGGFLALFLAIVSAAQAGGPLPPPRPDDLKAVQTCLASRDEFSQASCIGAASTVCLKTADSQQRMTDCMTRERAVWDTFLNNDYQAIMQSRTNPQARQALLDIERKFVADTEQRCTFIRTFAGYSSFIQVVEIEECWMQATAVQWLWLRDFLPQKNR